jgi:hypothetical protein
MSKDSAKPAPNDSPTGANEPVEKPRLDRGWRRYQQLRRQDAAERDRIAAALLEGLGRAPTERDRLAAENIASLTVRARTLERRGQFAEAAKVRQQVTQATRATGFKPQPAASQKPNAATAGLDYLRETYGSGGAR